VSLRKKMSQRVQRRLHRVRNGFASRGSKLRVTVFRSLKHIGAQIIDDSAGKTLVALSSKNLASLTGDKTAVARQVGTELGKLAVEKSLQVVYFDRGKFQYHGRVKALAEGLRESGLQF
jgi:large subunit ribosomal protein L18